METEFKIGDIVYLRSGGLALTIIDVTFENNRPKWHVTGFNKSGRLIELKLYCSSIVKVFLVEPDLRIEIEKVFAKLNNDLDNRMEIEAFSDALDAIKALIHD
jgi:uncharacterized protein YodC (DUF2158 family)